MIPEKDKTNQRGVYSRYGKGLWRVIAYCPEPSITMQNVITKERETFGISGSAHNAFDKINGLQVGQGSEIVENADLP